jgi:hypothetical protein
MCDLRDRVNFLGCRRYLPLPIGGMLAGLIKLRQFQLSADPGEPFRCSNANRISISCVLITLANRFSKLARDRPLRDGDTQA